MDFGRREFELGAVSIWGVELDRGWLFFSFFVFSLHTLVTPSQVLERPRSAFPLCNLRLSHPCFRPCLRCFVRGLSLVHWLVEWRDSRLIGIFTSNDDMAASFEGYHSLYFCAYLNGSLLFLNFFFSDVSRTDMYTCVSSPSLCPAKVSNSLFAHARI